MSTLILYSSKTGTTKRCVERVKEACKDGKCKVVDLKETKKVSFDGVERILIGGPIYMGKLEKNVRKFINNNKEDILNKQLYLFLVHMDEETEKEELFKKSFDEELINKAESKISFGGAFDIPNMNGFQRFIMKKVAKHTKSIDQVNYEAIDELSSNIF